MKQTWKPGTLIYPLPAVMVSCGILPEDFNIITLAWVGTICSTPPMCYISVRPERHSYGIIRREGEFVINLTTEKMAFATDWCGVHSGRNVHKFEEMGLTPSKSGIIETPCIEESPLSIECCVKERVSLGSHDMFIAEVVNVLAEETFLHPETGAFDMEAARLLAYSHGNYYELGKRIGKFGWSVQKKQATLRKQKGKQ